MSEQEKKNQHAVALGRRGGNARAAKLTPERMKEIAEIASLAAKKARESKKDAVVVAP